MPNEENPISLPLPLLLSPSILINTTAILANATDITRTREPTKGKVKLLQLFIRVPSGSRPPGSVLRPRNTSSKNER